MKKPLVIRPQRGHKWFVGGRVYCPRSQKRHDLGLDHLMYSEFVCPGCGVRIAAKEIGA
jgi:hypothetical protein